MSLLHLLVLLSAAGALVFFFTGWLARGGHGTDPALATRKEREKGEEALAARRECEQARAQLDELQATLKDTAARLVAEQQRCATTGEAKTAAERERDSAQAEAQRLLRESNTLGERLRSAETHNRDAFYQEEKTAEAWEQQLQEQKAEQLRQKETIDIELRSLRQTLDEQKAAGDLLVERERTAREGQTALARELEQARNDRQRREGEFKSLAESLRRTEEDQKEGQRAAATLHSQSEQTWRQKLQTTLTEHEARVSELEASWAAKQAALVGDMQQLSGELSRYKADCDALVVQNRELQAQHRVVSEALSAVGSTAATAQGEWQEAQARLAELERLRQDNAILREEKSHAEDSLRELATRGEDAREVRVQLAAAQAKLSELERILEENRKLRDEAADLRLHGDAAGELEKLTTEHKRLRLDAELMARRLSDLLQDQTELADLRARAQDMAALSDEVEYLRRREKDLEARLYASGRLTRDNLPAMTGVQALHTVGTNMEASLHALVQPDGPRTAVLADIQGFLIASAGETHHQEGLAAFAAIASDMVARTRMLLPLADVAAIRISDTNRIVLSCRLFSSGGQGLGVATLGPGEPSSEDADRVVSELSEVVAGKSATSDE
jgi:chromosome segregation ATPase